jgi:dolichol-phosphate mannosyltransferase/undecaprenyl-phosphate 4-deoxy-4-formamido-L-arabinose transferase
VLLERLSATLRACEVSHEIVVVNDASPDDTWSVLEALLPRHPALRAIDLLTNHGQARATICGLAQARGDLVATMDDDLEQPPEELAKLLEALRRQPDLDAVVGRWPREGPAWRQFGSRVHALVDRLAYGTPRDWRHTTFRMMRRPVVDTIVANQTRTPVLSPLLRQVTNRVANVDVAHDHRPHGRSGFRLRQGMRSVRTNFMQGSTLPLRALALFGVCTASVSALMAVYLVARWAFGVQTAPGWTSTLLGVTFFGGASLFGIGLLGEYLALVLEEVRQPPRWAVRQELGAPVAEAHDPALSASRNAPATRSTSPSERRL